MKILYVGEIVAEPGRKAVKAILPEVIREYAPDLVLSNCENLSGGKGITKENLQEMLNAGISFFTSGDHIFWRKEALDSFDNLPLVVPANYPANTTPGKPYAVLQTGKFGNILVFNLIGRTSFSSTFAYLDDPFRKADEILELHKDQNISLSILDFHGDASSEKVALGHYLDGRVDIIVGSHTHIPSADGMCLPKGTMYISDIGMTGAIDSVLGVQKEIIIQQFLTAQNQRFEWESTGRKVFRSVLFDTESKAIVRIDKMY